MCSSDLVLPDIEEVIPPIIDQNVDQVILTLDSLQALVNGEIRTLLSPPKVLEGRTLLPLRFVVDEILGAYVDWNGTDKIATVIKDDITVQVQLGNTTAYVNGMQITLDVAPVAENGVTLLPVRFMSETFGITSDYISETKQVKIGRAHV